MPDSIRNNNIIPNAVVSNLTTEVVSSSSENPSQVEITRNVSVSPSEILPIMHSEYGVPSENNYTLVQSILTF